MTRVLLKHRPLAAAILLVHAGCGGQVTVPEPSPTQVSPAQSIDLVRADESVSESANEEPLFSVALPDTGMEVRKRIALSDFLRSKPFLLVEGRFANPKVAGNKKTIQLRVTRQIKGELVIGGLVTVRDQFIIGCQGEGAISEHFSPQRSVYVWLYQSQGFEGESGKWEILRIRNSDERYRQIINAVTGKTPAQSLKPLIEPNKLDHDAVQLVKLLAEPKDVAPLLKQIVDDTPAKLEPFKGSPGPSYDARWQQRSKLFHQASQAIDILGFHSKWNDETLIDAILSYYPPLDDDGGKGMRLFLNYYLNQLLNSVPAANVKPQQVIAIRETILKDIRRSFDKSEPLTSWALSPLQSLCDDTTTKELLTLQARRPITKNHVAVVTALSHIIWRERGKSCDGKTSETFNQQVISTWLGTLREHDDALPADKNQAESIRKFVDEIAGALYQSNLTETHRSALRTMHAGSSHNWFRVTIERLAKRP